MWQLYYIRDKRDDNQRPQLNISLSKYLHRHYFNFDFHPLSVPNAFPTAIDGFYVSAAFGLINDRSP